MVRCSVALVLDSSSGTASDNDSRRDRNDTLGFEPVWDDQPISARRGGLGGNLALVCRRVLHNLVGRRLGLPGYLKRPGMSQGRWCLRYSTKEGWMRSASRRIARGWILLLGITAIAVAGCGGGGPAVPPSPGALKNCLNHTQVLVQSSNGEDSPVVTFQVPGDITLVPEYHDCQRLTDPQDGQFGPLAAVFASVGQTDSNPPLMPTADSAAALIVSSGSYPSLNIGPGNNCLYL